MGRLYIHDGTGDTTVPYTKTEYTEAEEAFGRAMLEGRLAITENHKLIRTFNPLAKEITVTPPMVGG